MAYTLSETAAQIPGYLIDIIAVNSKDENYTLPLLYNYTVRLDVYGIMYSPSKAMSSHPGELDRYFQKTKVLRISPLGDALGHGTRI